MDSFSASSCNFGVLVEGSNLRVFLFHHLGHTSMLCFKKKNDRRDHKMRIKIQGRKIIILNLIEENVLFFHFHMESWYLNIFNCSLLLE